MTQEREQNIENANLFIYRIAPRTVINWSKDEEGNDVGNIIFEVVKNTVVNGNLEYSERDTPLVVTIDEIASEFVNVFASNPDGTPNANELIPLFGWQVALFIKEYFDKKWKERQEERTQSEQDKNEGKLPDLPPPDENPTEEEPIA